MYKRILALLLLCSLKTQANDLYQINDALIKHKENIDVHLLMDENGFKVEKAGQLHEVQNCFVEPLLKNLKEQNKLDKFFEKGCFITIKEMDNGEFKLQSSVPGLGGGPVLANAVYWLTKCSCWGGVGLAVTGVAVATGGSAVGVAGMAVGTYGGAVAVALPAAGVGIQMGAAAATGAAVIGTVAPGAAAAAAGAGAVIASTGTVAASGGLIGFIEFVSLCAAGAALALPTP